MEENPVKPVNILYVDDIESNLILFELAFSKEHNVYLADSGQKALELLARHKFAVIVSDQRMPGMVGTELLEIVREKYPDVMRFILTAYSDYQTVVESINKGQIYGYFNKPFEIKEMRIALNKAIEVYNLRERNKLMMEDIERANMELRNIDKNKTDFLNALTNELRTPINKIMSVIHMLKDNLRTEDLAELINYLDTSVLKLEAFASTTNQLARLNEQTTLVKAEKVSLREVIELSILEKKSIFSLSGVKIEPANVSQNIKIEGDLELVLTCITKLLDNSIIHIEKGGSVEINTKEDEINKFIEIKFKAINYTSEQIDNLSSFFSNNKLISDYNMGIDLILARHIMAAHQGRISFNISEDHNVSIRMIFPFLIK